jgi:AcrR family transcriptional regulator
MESVKKRTTHRQRQALATQRLIMETARALFLEQGYGITTIEEIAAKAGVAVSTVYAVYKNKRTILKAIREQWHLESGQRDIYQQALRETDAVQRMALAAHATRRQWESSATMMLIYASAAAVDPQAAAELKEAEDGRRRFMHMFIQESKAMLRPPRDGAQASAVFLSLTRPEVYRELVTIAGWSPDAYEQWLAAVLISQLLPAGV